MDLDVIRGLTQPDQRSCGPSSLVAARLLLDPAYAATQNPHAFAGAVLDLHRRLTGARAFGRVQLPWPRALGTPPWAVARAMSSYAGVRYRTRILRWGSRVSELAELRAAVAEGRPCPLYVGDAVPRHVVLVVAPAEGGLRVYNPGRGSVDVMSEEAFTTGRLTTFGRWTRPWFAVLPASH
ncbi:hypothetical protein [Nocardioides halotolerans]|uniref:hypothetical protein n=1 Tax=Nocardioides halotolerans TaxID=433660 RepID=UPI000417B512|nr:hypothetical protein [Nocardioides halotolerans]